MTKLDTSVFLSYKSNLANHFLILHDVLQSFLDDFALKSESRWNQNSDPHIPFHSFAVLSILIKKKLNFESFWKSQVPSSFLFLLLKRLEYLIDTTPFGDSLFAFKVLSFDVILGWISKMEMVFFVIVWILMETFHHRRREGMEGFLQIFTHHHLNRSIFP